MKRVVGGLNVYREWSLRETLSATLRLDDGTELYWWKAPKCFTEVDGAYRGQRARISVTLNDNNQNPRNVVVL